VNLPFRANDLILFTGDSVTDCGRNRNDSSSMGSGYVGMIAERLRSRYRGLGLRFRNTGISGDRTGDLLARLDRDCAALGPAWVSLLVGVNNTWRRYDRNDPTPDDRFEAEYGELIRRIREETSARIAVCSPFLLHVDPQVAAMRGDLDPKIAIIRRLAEGSGAAWIDFDAAFLAAQQRHIPSYWAADGVHPTPAGHALMAETWLDVLIA